MVPKLEIKKIQFGLPDYWHFVLFTSGEHTTEVIEDRHDIDIEVMVSSSTKIEDVEAVALSKAHKFIKELAASL